jgi:DNA-binding IclR family transcriptional regulator
MSAPVFDRAGRVVLAIMLLGPNFDLTAAEMDALAGRLLAAAADATEQIGGIAAAPHRAVGAAS